MSATVRDPFATMLAHLGPARATTITERNRTWAEEGGYWPEPENEPIPGDDGWLQERADNWTEREL